MDKIRNDFDYIINYIKLISHDGKEYNFYPQFVELTYEESVFYPCAHGRIFVGDAIDFYTLLPLLGEERINVSFTRQDESAIEGDTLENITFDMSIFSVSGKFQDGAGSGKKQTYTLHYASDEVFKNVNTKIFKKYKNRPYSQMVSSVFNEYLKLDKELITVEPTKGDYTYLIQGKSAIATIEYLAKRCISGEDNGYSYVFFETRDGFHFTSLGKLAKQEPVASYTYQPKNVFEDTQQLAHKPKRLNSTLYSFESYAKYSSIDTLTSAMSGEAVSSLLTVDPIRRKFSLHAFDLRGESGYTQHQIPLVTNSSWDSFPHLDKKPAKPWKENSRMFINPLRNMKMLITDFGQNEQEYIVQRDLEANSFEPEFFVLQNSSQKMQLLKHIITATLPGDPRIKAGCVIEFYLPELLGTVSKQKPEEYDRYLQGRYLVAGVSHLLKKGEYRMNLDLIKDSFFSDIVSRDPIDELFD